MENIYADNAWGYFEFGYPCIPTHQETRLPLFGGYHGARKACVLFVTDKKTERQLIMPRHIEEWVRDYPNANIACVLPEGVMVIDVDSDEGSESFFQLAEDWNLQPNTFHTTAEEPVWGGHGHYWYATEGFVPTRIRYKPGLDIMGTGSLVHMPPTYSVKRGSYYKVVTL